ncbi:unnamed protein product [Sphagnum balticum]
MTSSQANLAPPPTLNYIWVGPPPKETGGEPGHDLIGPVAMASCNKTNPILFWCLEEYEKQYKELLANTPAIQVKTIESSLANEYKDNVIQTAATYTKAIIDEHLKSTRNTIRDRVSVKNIFSLFLLYSQGGYVLDTNVVPMDKSVAMQLPSYKDFHLPVFDMALHKSSDLDYWMLFSPPNNAIARSAFDAYIIRWGELQALFNGKKPSECYHKSLGGLIADILFDLTRGEIPRCGWVVRDKNQTRNVVLVPELKMYKYYFNTHKYQNRSEFDRDALYRDKVSELTGVIFPANVARIFAEYAPGQMDLETKEGAIYTQLFFDIANDDPAALLTHIEAGGDVNKQITHPVAQGETVLHLAIKMNRAECVSILLANNANPALEVHYQGSAPLSAYVLAEQSQCHPDIKVALRNHKLAHESQAPLSPKKK